jgi:hypothetical protein
MVQREHMTWVIWMALLVLGAGPGWPQEITVQPAKGQSQELMQKDIAECQASATQSTGFDPSQAEQEAKPAATGARARGAARGAVGGAVRAEAEGQQHEGYDHVNEEVKEEYREEEAREGAAAGAARAGRQQRRQNIKEAEAQKKAATAFNQAYQTCLQGRGYTVTPQQQPQQPSPPQQQQ